MRLSAVLLASAMLAFTPVASADQCRPDCGKVIEREHYEKEGKGSGLGMVAGGVAGALLGHQVGKGTGKTVATIGGAAGGAYLGNEIEKKSKKQKMLKVTVRMDDGDVRTFHFGDKDGFDIGRRVQVIDGKLRVYAGN